MTRLVLMAGLPGSGKTTLAMVASDLGGVLHQRYGQVGEAQAFLAHLRELRGRPA